MIHDPNDRTKGPSLWGIVAGFAAAALLTLAAAVGTSALHRQNAPPPKPFEAPFAQR